MKMIKPSHRVRPRPHVLLVALFLITGALAQPAEAQAPPDVKPAASLVTEPPQIVATDDQLSFTMDGSWAPLRRVDGRMFFFNTALAKKPYYFRYSGTIMNPLEKEEEPFTWDFNGFNDKWPLSLIHI